MKLQDATGLLTFLMEQRVATLAVPIDELGTLHIATMNYYHWLDPFALYFITSSKSEKCSLLREGKEVAAACNVGTFYGTPFTLQMRGTAKIISQDDAASILDGYFAKRGDKNRNVEGPGSVLLQFTPDWARFTDYAKGWHATLLQLP